MQSVDVLDRGTNILMAGKRANPSPEGDTIRDHRQRATGPTSIEGRDRVLLEAVLAYQVGELVDAESRCRRVLAESPHLAPAVLLLGMIASRTGRQQLAIDSFYEVIALQPKSIPARTELAIVLRAAGRLAEATKLSRQAVRLNPKDAGSRNNLGLSYLDEHRFDEAASEFLRAIAIKPDIAIFHYNLGLARQFAGRGLDAIAAFREALRHPSCPVNAALKLGILAYRYGKLDEALVWLRKAIDAEPRSGEAHVRLGEALLDRGNIEKAKLHLLRALALDERIADAHQLLGVIEQQFGRFDTAISRYEQAIGLQPRFANAYFGIASAKKITPSDSALIEGMSDLVMDQGLTDQDRSTLHYGLGKAFEDLQKFDQAMRHFDEANAIAFELLRQTGRVISRKIHVANIDRLIANFTSEFFVRNAGIGTDSELPILVVGMIRSGTTLIEQILSRHPEVGAGGELGYWGGKGAYLHSVESGDFARRHASSLASDYVDLLRSNAPESPRITDKMPTNFFMLGLIHLVLPNAVIIHCRRNPVDTCLSIYTTRYRNFPDFAHNRENITFYYEEYVRLMAHWRRVLPPNRFLDVDYEELVSNPASMIRRLISFCGLEWHESCLSDLHRERAIATPSNWQARQPIYRTSVGRWRRYKDSLGAFSRLLPAADG